MLFQTLLVKDFRGIGEFRSVSNKKYILNIRVLPSRTPAVMHPYDISECPKKTIVAGKKQRKLSSYYRIFACNSVTRT